MEQAQVRKPGRGAVVPRPASGVREEMKKQSRKRRGSLNQARACPCDDLTVISGIGIVEQDRLYKAGIRTYTELAQASPEAVRNLLGGLGLGVKVEEWTTRVRQLAETAR